MLPDTDDALDTISAAAGNCHLKSAAGDNGAGNSEADEARQPHCGAGLDALYSDGFILRPCASGHARGPRRGPDPSCRSRRPRK